MPNVTVYIDTYAHEELVDVWEGDYDVALQQDGRLVVVEAMPDVLNENDGKPIPRIRCIYNGRYWEKAEVTD